MTIPKTKIVHQWAIPSSLKRRMKVKNREARNPRRVLPNNRASVRVKERVRTRKNRKIFGKTFNWKLKTENWKLLSGFTKTMINPHIAHKTRLTIVVGRKFRRCNRVIKHILKIFMKYFIVDFNSFLLIMILSIKKLIEWSFWYPNEKK